MLGCWRDCSSSSESGFCSGHSNPSTLSFTLTPCLLCAQRHCHVVKTNCNTTAHQDILDNSRLPLFCQQDQSVRVHKPLPMPSLNKRRQGSYLLEVFYLMSVMKDEVRWIYSAATWWSLLWTHSINLQLYTITQNLLKVQNEFIFILLHQSIPLLFYFLFVITEFKMNLPIIPLEFTRNPNHINNPHVFAHNSFNKNDKLIMSEIWYLTVLTICHSRSN